ncbi:MAG: YfcE family phosphodiesterase [Oscillospiraceae bacterium]
MKVLVLSDSHGDKKSVSKIVDENQDAQLIIYLGDGERDLEYVPILNNHAEIVAVRGNCDMASQLSLNAVKFIDGHIFYITHGFVEKVKQGTTVLMKIAEKYNAGIVLYGHTHSPVNKIENSVHFFNPGSVKSGFYGVIDINGDDVKFEHRLVED